MILNFTNTTENLVDNGYIFDFLQIFVNTTFIFYGFITNLINSMVFMHSKLRSNSTFNYFLVIALANSIYMGVSFFYFVTRCRLICSFANSYASQLYLFIFCNYIKNIAAFVVLFFQITVSFQRFLIISNITKIKIPNIFLLLVVFILFSAGFNLPVVLSREIIKLPFKNGTQKEEFTLIFNDYGKSLFSKWFIISINIFRSVFLTSLVFIINILSLIEFRKSIEKKRKIKLSNKGDEESNESKANRNLTRMVIIMSFIYFGGNIPNIVTYILQQFLDNNGIVYRAYFFLVGIIYLGTQSSDILVFLKFNKVYRQTFKKMFTFKIK
ncbi:unnamed protein product [Brachionus calyciflorus]|uniref:G-protein coupled receptors family 1 profile domain-containing protein n=1 Tax=Brachionus calyciflorus TaxID=104777 RepID=A0A814DWC1_9BILA|nr:unnamed protein product [Brachionus calyciflorus]